MVYLQLVLFIACAGIAGANTIDFVVLLDVSESMFPYFDDTVNYLIRDILDEHLQEEDRFHFLSFADTPEIELSRKIAGPGDIEDILARILLLQPLGQHTDLIAAYKFLYSYTSRIGSDSNKKILVLTDGIHDPPPGSLYPVENGGAYTDTITAVSQNIRREGWSITLMQFPTGANTVGGDGSGGGRPGVGTQTNGGTQTGEDGAGAQTGDTAGAPTGGRSPGTGEQFADTDGRRTGSDTQTDTRSEGASGPSRSGESGTDTEDTGGSAQTDDDTGSADTTGSTEPDDSGERDNNLLGELSENLGVGIIDYEDPDSDLTHRAVGAPKLIFPDPLGRVGYRFTIPFRIGNDSENPVLVELSGILYESENILRESVRMTIAGEETKTLRANVSLPRRLEPGSRRLDLTLTFADDLRIFPHEGSVSIELVDTSGVSTGKTLRTIGIVILAIVGAGMLAAVVFLLRNVLMGMLASSSATPAVSQKQIEPGERGVEMVVEGQNRNIGTRNVHVIKDGGSRRIGGGSSDFLLFAYSFPPRVARLERSGESYTFVPLDEERCETSESVEKCINRQIVLRSDHGHRIPIVFKRYISPLERINRIMHLTDAPGKPSDDDE